MSNAALQGGAGGTGTVTLLAPSTSTDRTLTMPDATTTLAGLGVAQTFTATQTPYRATTTTASGDTTKTWTLTAGQVLEITLSNTASCTLSVSGGVAGTFYTLYVKQDGTGSRLLGWSGFKWPGGTVPTLSTGANAIDIFSFYYDGTSMCLTGKAQALA